MIKWRTANIINALLIILMSCDKCYNCTQHSILVTRMFYNQFNSRDWIGDIDIQNAF